MSTYGAGARGQILGGALSVLWNHHPLEEKSLTEDKQANRMTTQYEHQDEHCLASISTAHGCVWKGVDSVLLLEEMKVLSIWNVGHV